MVLRKVCVFAGSPMQLNPIKPGGAESILPTANLNLHYF